MKRVALSPGEMKRKAAAWLLEGVSPQRLALTLALGFVLGCIPLVGLPTGICVVLALVFRLNLPAIQAANYLAMPFQLALLMPLMRLGAKLVPATNAALDVSALAQSPVQMLLHSSGTVAAQLGVMAGQALLAWLLLAIPVVAVLTLTLTGVLRRVPAVAVARQRV
jgi:uncharacterized protein (DUF2062 family)